MSGYEYYEFKAIDTPLNDTQQAEVAGLSSRSQVTPMSAMFVYNYGSFRGDVSKMMNDYFDAMIYMANWGTKRLTLRIPAGLIDIKRCQSYCTSETINLKKISNKRIIIDFNFYEEDGYGWLEGEGWLDSLLALREAIIQGDLRVLYLAWLKSIQDLTYGVNNDVSALEPVVPPGLGRLSSALKNFVKYYDIDQALINAAAQNSHELTKQNIDLMRWITELPVKEQQNFLSRLSQGEKNLSVLLNRRLHELANTEQPVKDKPPKRRTVGQLFEAVDKSRQQQDDATKRKAAEQRHEALQTMINHQQPMWQQVDELIERKTSKAYDQAITLLVDLRDLAEYQNKLNIFKKRVDKIKRTYSRRSGLIGRLDTAKLLME